MRCPRTACRRARRPETVSCEPIVFTDVETVQKEFVVEDTNAAISAALLVNGGTPMICQEKGRKENRDYRENKKRLHELVKTKSRTLVLVSTNAATK